MKNRNKLIIATALVFLLLGLVTLANLTKKEDVDKQQVAELPLTTEVFTVNQDHVSSVVKGTVTNQQSLTLVATQPGPVASIYVTNGQQVAKGRILVQQSSAYNSGSAATYQRQIAEKNLELAESQLNTTVDTVVKNRELADLSRDNSLKLLDLSRDSINQTRDALELSESIADSLRTSIDQTNDPSAKLALKQQLAGVMSGVLQTRQALEI